jgi:hypothetical protein
MMDSTVGEAMTKTTFALASEKRRVFVRFAARNQIHPQELVRD